MKDILLFVRKFTDEGGMGYTLGFSRFVYTGSSLLEKIDETSCWDDPITLDEDDTELEFTALDALKSLCYEEELDYESFKDFEEMQSFLEEKIIFGL